MGSEDNPFTVSGYALSSGTKMFNGTSRGNDTCNDTYPIVAGQRLGNQHDTTYGPMKFVYKARYTLETIGSMTSTNDYLKVKPKFYWLYGRVIYDKIY